MSAEADVKKLVTAFRADGCGNLGCLFEGVLESQDHPYGCICDATRIETMDELRKHIHNAKDKGAVVRVVGSQHSASMRKYLHDGGKVCVSASNILHICQLANRYGVRASKPPEHLT